MTRRRTVLAGALGAAALTAFGPAAPASAKARRGPLILVGGSLADGNTEIYGEIVRRAGGADARIGVLTAASIPPSQDPDAGTPTRSTARPTGSTTPTCCVPTAPARPSGSPSTSTASAPPTTPPSPPWPRAAPATSSAAATSSATSPPCCTATRTPTPGCSPASAAATARARSSPEPAPAPRSSRAPTW
ncbi:hypothetical protein ACFQY4_18845 [Catellatospora bangladeshensis]|uniref:hypothetical protein n=1 Tax=Catellatospora bangladeshensis TaxID=310355 RepID=UPI00362189BD